jgi:hypothetical protein
MANHNGRKFSAKDKDVDAANYKSDKWSGHCAQMFKGGWWYDNCHRADLNGMYLKGNNTLYGKVPSESRRHNELLFCRNDEWYIMYTFPALPINIK